MFIINISCLQITDDPILRYVDKIWKTRYRVNNFYRRSGNFHKDEPTISYARGIDTREETRSVTPATCSVRDYGSQMTDSLLCRKFGY